MPEAWDLSPASRADEDSIDDRIEIRFPDSVLVRRGSYYATSRETRQPGILFGDWYVIEGSGPDSIGREPNSNFDVGHNLTGSQLLGGLTFWEARRVAMALDDADQFISVYLSEMDDDIYWVIDAVVASALMDHYVFPLSTYMESLDE